MNESALKAIANEQMPINAALRGFVNKTNYINNGVITKVHDENYVDVQLYYTNSEGKKTVFQAVRLLHIGTTKCKLIVTPAVGDNVLLLCPKDFIEKLEYNHSPSKSELCYVPYGNNNMCGILIKDEANDNVKTTITINENGDITVNTDGNITANCKGDLSVEAEGNATVTSPNTKLTGGNVEIGGTVTPSGQGALCGIAYCPYSGAPQTGKITQNA